MIKELKEIRCCELFAGVGGFRRGLEACNDEQENEMVGERNCERRNGEDVEKPEPREQSDNNSIGIDSQPWAGNEEGQCKPRIERRGGRNKQELHSRKEQSSRRFVTVYANDNDKYACQVYRKNYGGKELYEGDIRTVNADTIPDFDLLTAGFPCQSFSVAGKRKGFEDTRGTLFYEICRVIKAKRPRMLLLENVRGLLSHNGGETFATILHSLEDLGYWWEYQILNSKHFGVPQNRERVFIVGHLAGSGGGEVFPVFGDDEEVATEPELKKIGNVAETGHDSLWGRVYDPEGIATNLNSEGGGVGAKTGLYMINLHQWRTGKYGNGVKEDESFTLDQGSGRDYVLPQNSRIRRLTPVECERLMNFPDFWTARGIDRNGKEVVISDTQRYKLCGNSVVTSVVTFIGKKLMEVMEDE